jgi:hypothetical protein
MKWIKISDLLPKDKQKCLIYKDGNVSAGEYSTDIDVFWLDGHGIKVTQYDGPSLVEIDDVNYWMPIEEIELPEYSQILMGVGREKIVWTEKVAHNFVYRPPKESDPKQPTPIFKEWTIKIERSENIPDELPGQDTSSCGCKECCYCCK